VVSQQSRSAALAFYPSQNQAFRPASSNGFNVNNSVASIPQSQLGNFAINNPKTIYVRSNDGGTIDHLPEDIDMGTIGEDLEAHYV
jgi:hypothetical protein